MPMEVKMVGRLSLMVAMARHIKTSAKELRECNEIDVIFRMEKVGFSTEIAFGGKRLGVEGNLSIEDLTELTQKALQESGCNGIVKPDGDCCRVRLYGNPVKQFEMLQRLVRKYSGFDIEWDTFKFVQYNEVGEEDETIYLCYNEEECQRGIDFIRRVKTTKDVLKAKLVMDMGVLLSKHYERTTLVLAVETPCGKKKGSIIISE